MSSEPTRGRVSREIGVYALVGLLSGLAAFSVIGLWGADLRIPLDPHGDGLLHAMMVKTVVEQGWVLTNPSLGIPGELNLRDFPAIDNLAVLLIRIISAVIHDPGLVLNVFYLLTYPLIAVTAYYAGRRLGLSRSVAAMVGVLYSTMPYHFRRSVGHLFIGCYYTVPLLILVAVRLSEGWSLVERFEKRLPRVSWTRETIVALVICVVAGSAGVYYPFFGCAFLVVGGVIGSLGERRWSPFVGSLMLTALIAATLTINYAPTILHHQREGDPNVVNRQTWESEVYGLKIAQLVLPISEHRIDRLAKLKEDYKRNVPLSNENDMVSLGMIASLGFIVLLVRVVLGPFGRWSQDGLLDRLSVLNLAAILIGTIGGLGSLFALLVSPDIRAYNRVCVFIAFFSLVAVGRLLDGWAGRRGRIWLAPVAAMALIPLGILDQTSRIPSHVHDNPELVEYSRFAEKMEAVLEPGSMVFQLPYFPFPENGQVGRVHDYDHFRAYVTTTGLRWSYGAIRNRFGDSWQADVVSQPTESMVKNLAVSGFSAIYLDRNGYDDWGRALVGELETMMGPATARSDDDRYHLYMLAPVATSIERELGQEAFREIRSAVLHPLHIELRACFDPEKDDSDSWTWCRRNVALWIRNPSSDTRRVVVRARVVTPDPEPQQFKIRSSIWTEDFDTSPEGARIDRVVEVPPGTHEIRFRSEASRVNAPGDPRKLIFRFFDFEAHEVDENGNPVSSVSW